MENKEIVERVIELSGGEDNITSYLHCMTRLRMTVKDDSKVDVEGLKEVEKVKGYMRAGNQHQVIFGPGLVEKMYDEMQGIMPNIAQSEDEDNKEGDDNSKVGKFVTMITGIFMPLLGVIAGLGMLQGLTAVLLLTGVLTSDQPEYIFLQAIGTATLGFFPILVGYSSMKKFGQDPVYGIVIGIVLVGNMISGMVVSLTQHMTISGNDALSAAQKAEQIANIAHPQINYLFEGTPFQLAYFMKVFGLPLIIPMGGFVGAVILTIATSWVTAKFIKFFKKHIPDVVALFFVPMLSLLFGLTIGLLVLAVPITLFQDLFTTALLILLKLSPIVYGLVLGAVWPILVMFGIHWPIAIISMLTMAAGGNAANPDAYSQIIIANYPLNFAMTGTLIAMMVLFKNDKAKKENFVSCAFGTFFGISEPALYTVFIKNKAALYITMFAGAIGGALIMAFDLKQYRGGGLGIFQLPVFLKPTDPNIVPMVQGAIFCIISFIIGIGLTFVLAKYVKRDEEK